MKKKFFFHSESLRLVLVRLINARFSLPTWLWAFASVAFGYIVFSYALSRDPRIADFASALPFGGVVWGSLLILAGLCSMFSMAFGSKHGQQAGSMGSFILWIFGAISFAQDGFADVVIFAGPMLVFWAYKYLATFVREFPRL